MRPHDVIFMRRAAIALCLAVATAGWPFAAHAQTLPDDMPDASTQPRTLDEVETDIKRERESGAEIARRSQEMREELRKLRELMVHSAASTQRSEAALTRYERELRELEARDRAAAGDFDRRREQLALIVGALQRIALRPPITLANRADHANDAVRGALLLRSLVAELERKAAQLREEIAGYDMLRNAIRQSRSAVADAGSALGRARRSLQDLIERKQALLAETELDQSRQRARLQTLTDEAKTLRDLLAKVEREKTGSAASRSIASLTEPEGKIRSFAGARGQLTLPALGAVVPRFGSEERFGEFSKGLFIDARPGAQAVAPFDGQIVFAGPFRGYGRILILEHRDGYHSLIVGLGRIDVAVAQWVYAGEPIGTVGEHEAQGSQLYVEIRQNGRPVDPATWFSPRKS